MQKSKLWVEVLLFFVSPSSLLGQSCCGTVCNCASVAGDMKSHLHGSWYVVESQNFQACCLTSVTRAEHLARHAEAVRSSLLSKWCDGPTIWSPRCQIVLHDTHIAYVTAVGRGSERTVGSSLVSVNDGKTISRRIDLLGSGSDFLSAALPHELVHVILKERFSSKSIPRWADEGLAILSDPSSKQGRHHKDLTNALARGTTFHAAELLTRESYPDPDRMGAFYGQSASIAKFLVDRSSHKRFLDFIDQANAHGYDAALRECYGINDVSNLDREWRRHLKTPSRVAAPSS